MVNLPGNIVNHLRELGITTTSAILDGAHSFLVVSSFKCEGNICCHNLIPNPYMLTTHRGMLLMENLIFRITIWQALCC
jgi:hypothetical protein